MGAALRQKIREHWMREEVKDSWLGRGTRMGHFSYVGDAVVGKNVNIGAGTVTCNYDGVRKNRTDIGDDVFLGSDTMLVAPVKVGKEAKTGAGAVVTRDVPCGTLVMGVLRPLIEGKRGGKAEISRFCHRLLGVV